MQLLAPVLKLNRLLVRLEDPLQAVLLLLLRLWWGWSFFVTGKGKLLHLEQTAAFFGELGLPWPKLNAIIVPPAPEPLRLRSSRPSCRR